MRQLRLILNIVVTMSVAILSASVTTLSAKEAGWESVDIVEVNTIEAIVDETIVGETIEAEADEPEADEPETSEEFDKSAFLPHIGRVDRDINQRIFAYKGETMMGVTMSYMTLNSDNLSLMLMVNDIDIESLILSVSPFVGYFYRDNRAIGARFKYSKIDASLNSAQIDLGETNGIEIDIPEVSVFNESYTCAIYHRAYTAIDQAGHFGIFADAELSYTKGTTRLGYVSGGDWVSSLSKSNNYSLNFNPGISAFVFNNVCANVALQFGGISYSNIRQYDAENKQVGTRDSSDMNFQINLLAINIGITVHLW